MYTYIMTGITRNIIDEIYQDTQHQWRWTKTHPSNGEIVGKSTEGYYNRSDCESNLRRNSPGGQHPSDTWDIFPILGLWFWRLTAANGKIIGAAHEAFSSRANCVNNAEIHGYQGT